MARYCERCGRKLWLTHQKMTSYDTETGEKTVLYRKNYFCWVGILFGRGYEYDIQHSNFVTGDWEDYK